MRGRCPHKGIMGWNSITNPDTLNLGQIRGFYKVWLLSPKKIMGWNSITHLYNVNLDQIRGFYYVWLFSPQGDNGLEFHHPP